MAKRSRSTEVPTEFNSEVFSNVFGGLSGLVAGILAVPGLGVVPGLLVVAVTVLGAVVVAQLLTGAASGRRKRLSIEVAVALVLVFLLVVLVGTEPAAPSPPSSGRTPDATQTQRADAPVLGDPRTADPCSLLDPTALDEFGNTTIERRYGNFNRCDVIVSSSGNVVDVELDLELAAPDNRAAGGTGGLRVLPGREVDDQCEYTLLLADGNRVLVNAKLNDGQAGLCQMSNRATGAAARILRGLDEIPRRTVGSDVDSLARVDACTILHSDTISAVVAARSPVSTAGFAGWDCEWTSPDSPTTVFLRFDQDNELDDSDGRRVSLNGREIYVEPGGDGDDTCVAHVPYRTYHEDGAQVIELVFLHVAGPQSSDQLCAQVTRLAGDLRL